MVTYSQAQTGNKVYGGGGTSPNTGAVSAKGAQGYVKRELNKKAKAGVRKQVGKDGKSDTRSTVAAQALKRKALKAGGGAKTPKQLGINQSKPKSKLPGQSPVKDEKTPKKRPEVQITEDGQLQLPYTDTMSMAGLEALEQSNQSLLELNMAQQEQSREYADANRLLDQNQKLDNRDLLNSNASAGTAFSSQYSKGLKDTSRNYVDQRTQLDTENTAFLTSSSMQKAAIQEAFNRMLQAGAYDNVNELAQDAGNLGYGTSPKKVTNTKNNQGGGDRILTRKIKRNRRALKKAKSNSNTKRARMLKKRIKKLVKERKNN